MVQIISENRKPSTVEKFGRAFASAGQSFGENFSKFQMQKEQKKSEQMQRMQEDEAAKRFGIDLSGINDQKSRQAILENALKGQENESGFRRDLQRDEQQAMSDFNAKQALQHQKHQLESGGQQGNPESNEEKNIAQNAFNGMIKLLRGGNLGRGSKLGAGLFAGKTGRDVGEFQSLSGGLEAMLVDKVSKGTLSNERFKYITETLLPKPNDSDSIIEGKLKGLGQILGLDMSKLSGSGSKESGKKQSKKSLEDIFG